MIDRRQSVVEGAKTEREREAGMARKKGHGGLVVPNWNEMAESQKEIYILHRPSLPRVFSNYGEGLYHETISRHEQKFSSLVPPRCDIPRLFPPPLWPLFLSVMADQRGNISFEGFNVFRNFDRHVLLGAVLSLDGWTRDDGFSEIK